mgnify:CR=1 FL=1
MASILNRFVTIMKSNINDLLDKVEDPAKMADQTLRELREDLADVKKETAGVLADAKNANRKVEECKAQIQKYETAAINAVKQGADDDARTLLAKKQEYEEQLVSLQKTADLANANAEKMRQMHDKLVQNIESLETRRATIHAKNAAAKAQERVNRMTSGVDSEANLEAFNRMEAKADKRLDAAMAESDLNAEDHSTADLAEKYAGGGNTASVEDELTALKAKLGV